MRGNTPGRLAPGTVTPELRAEIARLWRSHPDCSTTDMACLASRELGLEIGVTLVGTSKPAELKKRGGAR